MTTGDNVLAAPLSVLGLTRRAYNALTGNGFRTVGDLVAATELEVWRLPQLGPASMDDIKSKLTARGLALSPGGLPRAKRK